LRPLREALLLRPCVLIALLFALLISFGAQSDVLAVENRSAIPSKPEQPDAEVPEELSLPEEVANDPATWPPDEAPPDEHPLLWPPHDQGGESAGNAVPPEQAKSFFSKLKWLGLRHSSTSGRNAGLGIPLVGTSWLNRSYYFGADIGTVWLTRPITNGLTTDIDTFGGIFGGCDWDYYWGTELSVNRATPEIINKNARDADRGDRLMEFTTSLMYYPWGDSVFRPYWRLGVGATDIDYPTDRGDRRDESLWTFPIGIGLKYPFRRWLAARAEFADQLALGNHGVATQHDLTLTFGLEWRFGVHPQSYWPWNPSRHIW
jgi:hypothetical protein